MGRPSVILLQNMRNLRQFSDCPNWNLAKYNLDKIGIKSPKEINYNLTHDELFDHEVKNSVFENIQ